MRLELTNIGIIKQADIKLVGLTVIAGENDTGKSTVSKALYSVIKSISKDNKVSNNNINSNFNKYFDGDISKDGQIIVSDDNKVSIDISIKDNISKINKVNTDTCFLIVENTNPNIIMIETPLIWNMMELFTKLPMIEDAMSLDLVYPKIMKDLHWNLSFKTKKENTDIIDISDDIKSIIQGEFLNNNESSFYFKKDNKNISLINTATGIKYFGILQILSKNNYLFENQILILDEPEVHLHPKWQLKLAQLIIKLVKNGVKVLLNSHSPYMIEALQRYSEQEKLEDISNYYLAEDGKIDKIDNSNNKTLSEIFEKLSEPFEEFDKMDSESLNG